MNLKEISEKIKTERQLRATTGLNYNQFSLLLPIFTQHLEQTKQDKHKNKDRKIGSGKKGDIETPTEKLLLILFYFKCYPTFDVLGFTFGIRGDAAHKYVYSLFIVLMKTLYDFGVLPHMNFKTPEELQAAFKEFDTLLIDATERAVQRSQNYDVQKEDYSGKKNSKLINAQLFRH
jgi:hypothetical protein